MSPEHNAEAVNINDPHVGSEWRHVVIDSEDESCCCDLERDNQNSWTTSVSVVTTSLEKLAGKQKSSSSDESQNIWNGYVHVFKNNLWFSLTWILFYVGPDYTKRSTKENL